MLHTNSLLHAPWDPSLGLSTDFQLDSGQVTGIFIGVWDHCLAETSTLLGRGLWGSHGVCYSIQTRFSQYFTDLFKCCAATTCFSLSTGVLHGDGG